LFALSNPALVSAPLKKSISSACCPNLVWSGARRGELNGFGVTAATAKDRSCVSQQLLLPVADLVGMNFERFAQFGQRLVFT
jgi:hypothetical protein